MEVIIDGVQYIPMPPFQGIDEETRRTLQNALSFRFSSDAGADITIRDYLSKLLLKLWKDKEGFSGKRPWGNSGWDYDLYTALIKGKYITGQLDEYGYIEIFSASEANKYVEQLILAMCYDEISV